MLAFLCRNGSKHLHGLSTVGGVQYGDLVFRSLDTSVVSVGKEMYLGC